MKTFKTITGERVDVVEHTLEVLKKYPTCKIHVGTDSQNMRKFTVYCTVIAYRYGSRGAHYIVFKEVIPKVRDMWTRLFAETERSLEVAEWFKNKINVPIAIDMDFNEDEFYDSYKLIAASKGWAVSLGYEVNTKPNLTIATKAADHHCRTGKLPRRRRAKES